MSKQPSNIEEVLKEWTALIKPKNDIENVIKLYGKKFYGVKFIDWEIDGKSIFMTPEGKEEQPVQITIVCDTWDDIDL
jgi:hypothetical protein